MSKSLPCCAAFAFALVGLFAQPTEPPGSPDDSRPKAPSALDRRNRPGPWHNDVMVYAVGSNGLPKQLTVFERAGVPTVARMNDGRLIAAHQHFPENDEPNFDKVAVHFSSDEGRTWTPPQIIQMDGLPEGMRFPFDPTLVPLPDGRIRLYFTSVRGRRVDEQPPAIYSGISTNGVHYLFEPGVRFGIEGRLVIDCAVVLHKGVFHLYGPNNGTARRRGPEPEREREDGPRIGEAYYATSPDGLNFTRRDDVKIDGRRRWLGSAQSDGKKITFYGTGEQPGGVWMAASEDGAKWQLGEQQARLPGADPGAVTLRDGTLLIVATGKPRPGTPSSQRRPPPWPE
jgi:hypothetical protein